MSRRRKPERGEAAEAMRAAMAGVRREMAAAPPERAGALAEKLFRMAQALAAEDDRARNAPPNMQAFTDMRLAFDAEVERLIEERVEEQVRYSSRKT